MKKWILLLLAAVDISVAYAQEEFRITGKANGLTDGTLLLLIDEGGQDTLATTLIKNGVFMFTGKVDSPSAAYIMISNGKEMIPLILENVPFTINLSKQGALIQGGEQQEIFGQFNRISNRLLREQGRIQQVYTRAEQARDKVGVKAAMKQFEEAIAVARAEEKALREKYPDLYVIAYVVALGWGRLPGARLPVRKSLRCWIVTLPWRWERLLRTLPQPNLMAIRLLCMAFLRS